MSKRSSILAWDAAHVWHPYTQMQTWASAEPLVIERAQGCLLTDVDGRQYLDGNASWWVAAAGFVALRRRAQRTSP